MNLNQSSTNENAKNPAAPRKAVAKFNLGQEVFSWTALDYQPHHRGIIWYTVFCSIFFGGAVWSMISDPKWGWLMALALFLSAAVYFYAHHKGEQTHEIKVFERGLFIDNKFFPLEKFAGFWLLYDETANMVNLQVESKRRKYKISLQMGDKSPEFFRENFAKVGLAELSDTKESLLDLWIRALKL